MGNHIKSMDSLFSIQGRGRGTTIRPNGAKPGITRGYSVEFGLIQDCKGSDDDDEDILMMQSDDDDDDIAVISAKQSELIFHSTAQSLLVSCGDSKIVFASLRQICISLKQDELLPFTLSFDD